MTYSRKRMGYLLSAQILDVKIQGRVNGQNHECYTQKVEMTKNHYQEWLMSIPSRYEKINVSVLRHFISSAEKVDEKMNVMYLREARSLQHSMSQNDFLLIGI